MSYEDILTYLDKLRNVKAIVSSVFGLKKEDLKKNSNMKGTLKGKRCFVLGNAPSLKEQDLSLLKDEFVITVNQITRNPQFEDIKTNVHFWADAGFFNEENTNEEFIEVMKSVDSKDNHPIVFYPLFAKNFVKNHNLDETLNIHYFNPIYCFHGKYKREIDFCKGIPGFHTVVDYGIALAIYMGASEIYLLGCDCTGIVNTIKSFQDDVTSEYAYEITEEEKKRMKKMQDANLLENHFYSWYKTFQQYRYLYEYCSKRNIKLINCTKGGILQELPRVKYEDVVIKKVERVNENATKE